ncbi:MAG: AI-2E family transporter [Armatimonadetes bacterium]|jgi:predicted PurR-regulated permease PerM|nr:AI-2E family transporter [Armatimonadota bacterium]
MLPLGTRSQTMFLLIWGILWRLAAIFLAGYVAYRVRFIVVIVLLSAILTFLVLPVVERACQARPRRVSRNTWRFTVTLGVFIALISMCVAVLLWIWSPFQTQLSELQRNMGSYQATIEEHLTGLRQWYLRLPPSMREALEGQPIEGVTHYLFGVLQKIIESTVSWVSHAWELILIPVLAFYFCLDTRSLKRDLFFLVPYGRVRETLYLLRHTAHIMQNYVVAQLVLCVVAGMVVGVGLWALKVPYPLVLGVLAGITRAVPIVGPVISAIPITLVAATISLKMGVSVLLFFCCLHLFESKVLLPELIGHKMKLHPAVVLIVLLIGGEFFGILGMFLAAPVAAIGRLLLGFYIVEPELRRRKLGSEAPVELVEEPESAFRKVS